MLCFKVVAASVLVGLVLSRTAYSHGDIHLRIADLDRRIEAGPVTAALLIKRAELHRADGAWWLSQQDLDRAAVLAPGDPTFSFHRGRLLLESGDVERALRELDIFIEGHPRRPQALLLRARAHSRLGAPRKGAADLALAIDSLPSPTPELYLERAQMLSEAGESHVDEALRAIDDGLGQLGAVVALIEFAIIHEANRGRYSSALTYLDQLPRGLRERPAWLVKRAELLRGLGRDKLARAAVDAARESIESLPRSRAGTRATLALLERLNAMEDR